MIGRIIRISHNQYVTAGYVIRAHRVIADNNTPMPAPVYIFDHNRYIAFKMLDYKCFKFLCILRCFIFIS